MAIKRRPTDEDDDYDDEDDDRPRKKRRSRDDEDDDDDRPRGKMRSRSRDDDDGEDEDEEEERRSRKRRSRVEDDREDEEDEDDRRPRKRRSRDDEEDEEDVEDDDEDDGGAEEDEEEDPYEQWTRQQAKKRQQLVTTGEAMLTYRKRAQFHIFYMASTVIGAGLLGGTFFLFGPSLAGMISGVLGLVQTALLIGIPVNGIIGANKFKAGVPKLAEQQLLTLDLIGCVVVLILYFVPAPLYFLLGIADFTMLLLILFAGIGSFIAYHVSFALGLFYLRTVAQQYKLRLVAANAQFRAIQIMLVAFVGTPLLGVAAFFLAKMGMVGYVVTLGLSIVWLLAYLKGFVQFMEVCTLLNIEVVKKIARLDKPDW